MTDASGQPVANAVVMVDVPGTPKPSASGKFVMSQENLTFDPFILIVPAGAEVSFPNLDRVRHHVYSFSRGNRFELRLYGREEQRSATFNTPGIVAIGCNIHDEMVAYIRVVETPYAALTNTAGEAVIDLPAAAGRATIWHPEATGQETRVDVPAANRSGPVTATLRMRTRRHGHGH
ncbi:methylamine utilization protein [Hyphomonas sp.]|uniref:methylamine utilization protein n=1 Tax=Hyphomonas sp. TaxID=87 RepID=UPI0039198E0B